MHRDIKRKSPLNSAVILSTCNSAGTVTIAPGPDAMFFK